MLEAGYVGVILNWTSANRDGPCLATPTPDPVRHGAHNLVWGTGIHACPGRPLATMELVVAANSLLQATTAIEPAPHQAPVRETYPLGGWRSAGYLAVAPVIYSFIATFCIASIQGSNNRTPRTATVAPVLGVQRQYLRFTMSAPVIASRTTTAYSFILDVFWRHCHPV